MLQNYTYPLNFVLIDNINRLIQIFYQIKMDINSTLLKTDNNGCADLIARKQPDEDLMKCIHAVYSDYFYSISSYIVKSSRLSDDDAEDCYSHIMEKLFDKQCRRLKEFKGKSSYKTYLTSVCRNLTYDYIRNAVKHNKKHIWTDNPEEIIDRASLTDMDKQFFADPQIQYIRTEKDLQMKKVIKGVSTAMEKLPPREKLILKCRLEKRLKYREIDELLKIENSVYEVSRALQLLRNSIDSETKQLIDDLLEDN